MKNTSRILIVEDELITAMELQDSLVSLGFINEGHASSGEDAIQMIHKNKPDLILMDIKLKGKLDGIDTAKEIHYSYDIPVIYLTAFSDDLTRIRAKITEPFGYLLKPINRKELLAAIEISLYRHNMEKQIKERKQWFHTILDSIGDAVIAVDMKGRIEYMNPVAEEIGEWNKEEIYGKKIESVVQLSKSRCKKPLIYPVMQTIKDGEMIILDKNIYLVKNNSIKIPVDIKTTPIKNEAGNLIGAVLTFRDISKRIKNERQREKLIKDLQKALKRVKSLEGLLPICSWCNKIHDNNGKWLRLETYIHEHSKATFTHGMCPECSKRVIAEEGLEN